MEAEGIEPSSRDASTMASTCVVELFWAETLFAHRGAARQAPPLASSNQNLTRRVSSRTAGDPELHLTVGRFWQAPSVRDACS